MPLQESGEMYLETIYILSRNNENVRSLDVAEYMGFSKPSVSRAVSMLKREEYITCDKNGFLTLTRKGTDTAEKIFERHTILTAFLEKIGVASQTASKDACKMEHHISEETFTAFKKYAEKVINEKD